MSAERVAELNRQIAQRSAELVELLAGGDASPSNDAPPYLSIDGFAQRFQVSEKTVRRMMHEGLPFERPRKRAVRIPVAEAEAWIKARRDAERTARLDAEGESVR